MTMPIRDPDWCTSTVEGAAAWARVKGEFDYAPHPDDEKPSRDELADDWQCKP